MLPALTESIGKNMRVTLCYPGIKLIVGTARWWLPCVIKRKRLVLCFYVGHLHEERAQVGLPDQRTGLQAGKSILIIPHVPRGDWDSVAVYKPFVLRVGDKVDDVWYNGAACEEPVGI